MGVADSPEASTPSLFSLSPVAILLKRSKGRSINKKAQGNLIQVTTDSNRINGIEEIWVMAGDPILQESGWEELRKEARKIEGDLDVKLNSYNKLGARFSQGGYVDTTSPTVGSWKSMEMEIQSLLEKLLDVNDSMSRCAASAAPTTSVTQKLARHRDILHECTQEFRRIKGNINSMKEHAELLTSVRDDISEYKASGSPRIQILRERAAIHGSISHMDEVISQAQTTRAVLGSQRGMFGDVQGKVKQLGDKFPIIRGLIGSIRRKRSRDTLILAAVIAACTLFLIIYWLSK